MPLKKVKIGIPIGYLLCWRIWIMKVVSVLKIHLKKLYL